MKNGKAVFLVIIAAAVVTSGAVFAYLGSRSDRLPSAVSKPAAPVSAASASATSTPAGVQNGQVKFSTSPYAQFAYLISGNTLSPEAQHALTGYELVKAKQANGDTQITLRSTSAPAPDQIYTLTPGESLYFVDYVLGDDAQPRDYSPNDDKAIVVDRNGNIVSQ
ncbi:MAG: hypothetical protein KGL39_06030 [Patescibacteria group bacterium]|nr:hypothetical protein [Patescibacteria group bacterium]